MGDRERLPARRNTLVIDVKHPLMKVTVQVGFYPDWRVGEFFITGAGLLGSFADTSARDFAVVTSIALQHGAPLELMAAATLKTHDGAPDGVQGAVLAALVDLQKQVRGEA